MLTQIAGSGVGEKGPDAPVDLNILIGELTAFYFTTLGSNV